MSETIHERRATAAFGCAMGAAIATVGIDIGVITLVATDIPVLKNLLLFNAAAAATSTGFIVAGMCHQQRHTDSFKQTDAADRLPKHRIFING